MRHRKDPPEAATSTGSQPTPDEQSSSIAQNDTEFHDKVYYEETDRGKQRNEEYQRQVRPNKRGYEVFVWFFILAATFACVAVYATIVLKQRSQQFPRVFTPEELTHYNGTKGLYYLALLGDVFDVSKNADKYYGPKGGYAFFVGRDASKGFITGEFVKDLSDDVSDFEPEACAGLVGWRDFYHKDYYFKGHVVGRFFDAQGRPTAAHAAVLQCADKAKEIEEQRKKARKNIPSCNMRWSQEEGGFVWCDDEMYPRKLIEFEEGTKKRLERCACFKEIGWSDLRQIYPKCDPNAHSCLTTPPDSQQAAVGASP